MVVMIRCIFVILIMVWLRGVAMAFAMAVVRVSAFVMAGMEVLMHHTARHPCKDAGCQ
jgi:hypothetical protein